MAHEAQMENLRRDVAARVEQRGLVSLMNHTRWTALVEAVYARLPFPPPYQAKGILADAPEPDVFDHDVGYHGAWQELFPYFDVEWIRVRPRWLKHRGQLVPPEVIDCSAEFLALLRELRVPHRVDADTVWIYGYAASTAGITQ
jgi:hypothetical protein